MPAMTTPSNSFAAAFDTIEINPASAPSPAAIEAAMAMCAPADAPGFFLLDDCGGRFVVDREFGFISVKDEVTLEAERGSIRAVRLKVIEPSGESYELALRLRVSGRVPQVVSEPEPAPEPTPEPPAQASAAKTPWAAFAGFSGARAESFARDEDASFACIVEPPCAEAPDGGCDLHFGAEPPRPANASAHWLPA